MPKVKREKKIPKAKVVHYFDLTGMEPLEMDSSKLPPAKLPTRSKNEDASVVDWCDVSEDDSWETLHSDGFFEPSWELPRGWTMHDPKKGAVNAEERGHQWIYTFKEFDVRVRGCKNMWDADRKITKWKLKYQKHDRCKHCKHAPCCLTHMADLLREEGEDLKSPSDIQNKCVRYSLYRVTARNYFGFLGDC